MRVLDRRALACGCTSVFHSEWEECASDESVGEQGHKGHLGFLKSQGQGVGRVRRQGWTGGQGEPSYTWDKKMEQSCSIDLLKYILSL